jgi:putative ABC transport system ATP-binding protein
MTPMLSLAGVNKRFHIGAPSETMALRDIDLTLAAGDFVTIIGSNGAGKSTCSRQ